MKNNKNKIKTFGALILFGLIGSTGVFADENQIINTQNLGSNLNLINIDCINKIDYSLFLDNINISNDDKKEVNSINLKLETIGKNINDIYEKNQKEYDKIFDSLEKKHFKNENALDKFQIKMNALDKKLGLDKLFDKEEKYQKKINVIYEKYKIEIDYKEIKLSQEEQKDLDDIGERIDIIINKYQKDFDELQNQEDLLFNSVEDDKFDDKFEKELNKLNSRKSELENRLGLDKLYEEQNKILKIIK